MTTDRTTHADRYRIFLLTFWLEEEGALGEPESWRFRLTDPRSGEQWGYIGVERFVELLGNEISDKPLSASTRIRIEQ